MHDGRNSGIAQALADCASNKFRFPSLVCDVHATQGRLIGFSALLHEFNDALGSHGKTGRRRLAPAEDSD